MRAKESASAGPTSLPSQIPYPTPSPLLTTDGFFTPKNNSPTSTMTYQGHGLKQTFELGGNSLLNLAMGNQRC